LRKARLSKLPHKAWDDRASAALNARRRLPSLVTAYFEQVRTMLADDPPPAKLHRLRLATKRLRYTLELFRSCYGPGFEIRLADLRQAQQLLGEINDCTASASLIAQAVKDPAQANQVAGFLDQAARQKAAFFRERWTGTFDAPGRERWFTGYLTRQTRAPRR
jgi:CHAD domain-containing protein